LLSRHGLHVQDLLHQRCNISRFVEESRSAMLHRLTQAAGTARFRYAF
jgi:hypothetical protein